MPDADFFCRFGLFVQRDFLTPSFCKKIREKAVSASSYNAAIFKGKKLVLDKKTRKVRRAEISVALETRIRRKLLATIPALEKHFALKLSDCQPPQVLIYRPGDFYKPHLDHDARANAPHFAKQRLVSVVIFLNREGKRSRRGGYSGGALTFFGLMADPRMNTIGFPLLGEEGLLIAFRSDLLHEVKPVILGKRFTIVSWYF